MWSHLNFDATQNIVTPPKIKQAQALNQQISDSFDEIPPAMLPEDSALAAFLLFRCRLKASSQRWTEKNTQTGRERLEVTMTCNDIF